MDWEIILLRLGGLKYFIFKRNKGILTILLWSLIPLVIQMALLKTFTARYILPSMSPLLFIAAWFIVEIPKELLKKQQKFLYPPTLVLTLTFALSFDLRLLLHPASAALPRDEGMG